MCLLRRTQEGFAGQVEVICGKEESEGKRGGNKRKRLKTKKALDSQYILGRSLMSSIISRTSLDKPASGKDGQNTAVRR